MDMLDIFTKQEDLLPELRPFVSNGKLGEMLQHPYFYQLFYHPSLNAWCNEQYRTKKKAIERSFENKEWNSFIWLHERPYRLQQFVKIQEYLSDEDYWYLFGMIWIDSENLWQYGNALENLLTCQRTGREHLMTDDEKDFLKSLPEEFKVYRGHQSINRLGYSWSLSYWKAKWFSQRFQKKRQGVVEAYVKKSDIFTVMLRRNEFEIIVLPQSLQEIKPSSKKPRPEWLEEIFTEATKNYVLGSNSYHNHWHWEKVEKNALILSAKTKGADKVVARIFALLHDSKRENEDNDPDHGRRAADYAKKLFKNGKLPINKMQLGKLTEACVYHNDGQVTDDPTIGVCWDSDRLDLSRVGIMPNPDLISTQAGKELLWKI